MKEIRIGPPGQLLLLVLALGAIAGLIGLQMPEIQRYLKIARM